MFDSHHSSAACSQFRYLSCRLYLLPSLLISSLYQANPQVSPGLTKMEHANRGAKALDSDPQTAIVEYTKALIEHPTSPDYFTQRSIAFTRTKPPRHDLALQDAELAVLCGQKRGKRDQIQAGQQRRLVAYYNLGRYADAKLVLDTMKKWRPANSKPQEMEHSMWDARISNKLKTYPQEGSVAEYPSQSLPDESTMRQLLRRQLKADGTFNYDGDDVQTQEETSTQASDGTIAQTVNAAQPVPSAASVPAQKVRHEWYQNNQNVILTLYAKGVPKDKVEVEIEENSVSVSFPHPSDAASTFAFTLDPLFALIDPSKSKHQVMSTKVELTLAKAVQGQKWANLEGTGPLKRADGSSIQGDAGPSAIPSSISHQPSVTQTNAPSYPSSSKTGPKNWDKLANDLTAAKPTKKKAGDSDSDGEADDDGYESDYGGDAVDGFFKKLYAGADPDTRRAMMKSFTESNGTALSTNWAEVGKKRVEEVKGKDEE